MHNVWQKGKEEEVDLEWDNDSEAPYCPMWTVEGFSFEVGLVKKHGKYFLSLPHESFDLTMRMIKQGKRYAHPTPEAAIAAARLMYPERLKILNGLEKL